MKAEHGQNDRRSWLHNMSVPSRSVVRCARSTIPGRRYLVDGLGSRLDEESAAALAAAVHECLAQDGMAALAALVELHRARRKLTPGRVRRWAGRRRDDPAATIGRAFAEVLPPPGAPDILGVFLPAPPVTEVDLFRRERSTPLDPLTSLAVLAHRSGPLYVPARPVEPSLIVLERCLLVIPE